MNTDKKTEVDKLIEKDLELKNLFVVHDKRIAIVRQYLDEARDIIKRSRV